MPATSAHPGTRSAGRLAAGWLLLAIATLPGAALVDVEGQETDSPPEQFLGSLDVRLHPRQGRLEPPAEMLLTDLRRRRTGRDPRTGARLVEIPESYHETEGIDDDLGEQRGPRTAVLHVANPMPGEYRLEVFGREPGEYTLEIRALDRAMHPTSARIAGVAIVEGAVHEYRIRYSNVEGAVVQVDVPDHEP